VCAENQMNKALEIIPEWWGIYLAMNIDGIAQLSLVKAAIKNETLNPFALLQFLNKDELISFGVRYDLGHPGTLRKTQKYRLWQIIAAKVDIGEIPICELTCFLRQSLKSRDGRIDPLPT
jgi:hypothetical protein